MTTAPARTVPAFDASFLRRVHLGSLALTVLFAAFTALYVSLDFGLGFLCAGLWSTTNLWVLERLMREAIRPGRRDLLTVAGAGVVKLPVLYGLLILMLMRGGFPAASVVIGLSLPLIVIVLKAFGRALAARNATAPSLGKLADSATATPEPRS